MPFVGPEKKRLFSTLFLADRLGESVLTVPPHLVGHLEWRSFGGLWPETESFSPLGARSVYSVICTNVFGRPMGFISE